jgi:hypothetical protein
VRSIELVSGKLNGIPGQFGLFNRPTPIEQAKLTRDTIQLARDEFNATHRPEIRLKHIWLASGDGQEFIGRIKEGLPITVRLDIVNVGSTDAFIDLINFVTVIIRLGDRLPQRPPYNEPKVLQFSIGGFRLESGITLAHPVSDGRILTQKDLRDIQSGAMRLYFVGTIDYWDASRKRRQTAFCRYLGDDGRFHKEDDPDYEYQD